MAFTIAYVIFFFVFLHLNNDTNPYEPPLFIHKDLGV